VDILLHFDKKLDDPVQLVQKLSSVTSQLQDEPDLFPDEAIPLLAIGIKAPWPGTIGTPLHRRMFVDFAVKLGARSKELLPILDGFAEEGSLADYQAAKKIRAALAKKD
jgi:hypothetical protein